MMPISKLLHFSVVCYTQGPVAWILPGCWGLPYRQVSPPLQTWEISSDRGGHSFADQYVWNLKFKLTDDLTLEKAPNCP